MSRFLHWLQHKFGANHGTAECWWDGEVLMAGFKCAGCGKLSHVHEAVAAACIELDREKGG